MCIRDSINGSEVVLYETDLLIDTAQIEGYVSEQDNDITVVLDTNLTPELIEEGFVRELISKVQTMRKEAGFEVMDRIRLYAADNEKILTVLKDHMDAVSYTHLYARLLTASTRADTALSISVMEALDLSRTAFAAVKALFSAAAESAV